MAATTSLRRSKDLFSSREGLNLDSYMDKDANSQFSVFRDYLGLINLIQPEATLALYSLDSPCDSVDSIFDYPIVSSSKLNRHRINSLDSDEISDVSSSNGSRYENDVVIDSLSSSDEFKPYLPVSKPSPQLTDNFFTPAPTYAQSLESFIASQTSVVSQQIQQHVQQQVQNKALKNLNKASVCVFCRNNGESREFYSSHTLKDNDGNTTCPILRAYTCPLCKAHGNESHTIKYCPKYTPKPKTDKLLGLGIPLL